MQDVVLQTIEDSNKKSWCAKCKSGFPKKVISKKIPSLLTVGGTFTQMPGSPLIFTLLKLRVDQ